MNDKLLITYARLVLYRGLNLKEDEDLVINAPISAQDFVRALVQEAYKTFKSGTVHINWQDPILPRITYAYAKDTVLEDVPEYVLDRYRNTINRKAAFLNISSPVPGMSNKLDPKKVQKAQNALNAKMRPYQEEIAKTLKWSTAVYPSLIWAKKVYPESNDSDALMKLHEALITIMMLDDQKPIETWTTHLNDLEKKRQKLNQYKFRRLHYKSKETDLTVELPSDHIWLSGAQKRNEDVFLPNMPAYELFTAPLKTGVNGKVKVTKPLSVRGKLIKPFALTLKYGEIVEIDSEDQSTLEKIIALDDGARFLGEVGLVPIESPVNQLNTVFYNNILDENASCHFAIGNAYPMSVKTKGLKPKEIAEKHNINRSKLHIDFMVGSNDLTIIGHQENGETVEIFKNGTWAKHFK